MKDLKLTDVGVMASLLLLSACEGGSAPGNATGAIAPKLSYDSTLLTADESADISVVAGLEDVKVGDLQLTLVSADGETNETFLAENFPTDEEFATGEYTLTATYGDVDAEGFEVPAISGESKFEVTEDNTTVVELTATPSKAMVSVTIDAALVEYMTSVSAILTSNTGTEIAYAADESRYAFVKPGQTSLSITFVKPNGLSATVEAASFDAEARHHYAIEVKAAGEGFGEVTDLIVRFDDSVEQEEVMVDISDEVLTLPAPMITPEGFAAGQEFTVVEGDKLPEGARFDIHARNGIAKAVLTTSGYALTAQGWPSEIDLTKASPTEQAMLTRLGYRDLGLFRNPSKMAAADLGGVVAHIPASTTSSSQVAFSLVVTDTKGKSSEPIGFSVSVIKLQLSLSVSSGYTYTGGKNLMCVVNYNGDQNLKEILTMQYKNENGEFVDGAITAVTSPSQAGSNDYTVVMAAPTDMGLPITLRGKCGDLISNEIEVPHSGEPKLTVAANDVYATSAWATISSSNLATMTPIAQISYDNGRTFSDVSVTRQGNSIRYTNLTAGTAYQLRVKLGALVSDAVSIRTEDATQIPNSDMEEWDSSEVISKMAGAYKWTNYKPGYPWATINDASLSGASSSGQCTANETAMYTVESHSGERAAEVRSAACSPYTLTSSSEWSYYRGELFVGSYSGGANYGISFSSRPSGLRFWYEYLPYEGTADQGYAMIQVLDSNGEILASGETRLDPTSAYREVNIALSYKRTAAKASKIVVLFRSSATMDFMNSTGFPSIGGSLSKKLTGSKLYVDDIELTY